MDQAEKLRQLLHKEESKDTSPIKVITISSGKGGVGKTNIAVNLGLGLIQKGFRVAILDGDIGMANVNVLMGLKCQLTIYDVLYENKHIDEIIYSSSDGLRVISGGSGIRELMDLSANAATKLINEFSRLKDIDILIIDTGAGASQLVLNFIKAADRAIVVTNPEPTAITDAYGLIKIILKDGLSTKLNLIINKAMNIKDAREAFNKLSYPIEFFLKTKVDYLGYVCDDSRVMRSVRNQVPFIIEYPNCEASLCIKNICSELVGDNEKSKNSSIGDFISRLLHATVR
jgi:flagellar biosynthesis protein FlhG